MDAKTELNAILNAAVDGFITADGHGIITSVNQSACTMFGHDEAAMIGHGVALLMPAFWAERHAHFMASYAATGQKRIIGTGRDLYGRHKDGSEFPMHLTVGEYDINGDKQFVGIVHDLTHRRRNEDQVRQLQKMDALGQMTAGLAHDFNNFLTVIIGNLELLQSTATEPVSAALLQDAVEAAETGSQLVRRLLLFARRGQMEPEALDPAVLIRQFAPILEATLGSQIEVILNFSDTTSTLMADPVQLKTAILNIALNSRDAMPNGGRFVVEMRAVDVDADLLAAELGMVSGRYLLISASDTGAGMTADVRQRAFEPFFSTKSVGHGTGLGLPMVYGFARQSGGYVAIYSEIGLGTTINLYLPEYAAAATAKSPSARAVPLGQTRFDAHILLVEDDTKVRAIAHALLLRLGCRVTEAATASEAVGILQLGASFDLVFTDLAMPGPMSGLDLCDHVRQHYPGLPVLLTSGYAEDVVHADLIRLHAIALLRKPYRISNLSRQLEVLLKTTSTSGAKR